MSRVTWPEVLRVLPPCVSKCDVCGHEPVDMWAEGFGCDHCMGAEAVRRFCEASWAATPNDGGD